MPAKIQIMKMRIKTLLCILAAILLSYGAPVFAQSYIRDVKYNGNETTANSEVRCITELAYQSNPANNKKKIIGGSFGIYDGYASPCIVRINHNGTIDKTFKSPGTFNGAVYCVTEGRDGKLYVGGTFTRIGDVVASGIVRLNSDGSIDNTFNTGTGFNGYSWSGAAPAIWSILVKDDPVLDAVDAGVLVGGVFKRFNGSYIDGPDDEGGLVQLNFNGSLNRSFHVNDDCCTGGGILDMAFDYNGQIVIGGEFGAIDGTRMRRLARLNRRGGFGSTPIIDPTFINNNFPNGAVYTVAVQPDNKILLGGIFTSFLKYDWSGVSGTGAHIARLNADGTIDMPGDADADDDFIVGTGFTLSSGVAFPGVRAIEVDISGKIWVGGDLRSYNGVETYNMVRLENNGLLDNTLNIGIGFNSTVWDIIVMPETYKVHGTTKVNPSAAVFIAGSFTSFNGESSKGNYMKAEEVSVLAANELQFKAVKQANYTIKLQWQDCGATRYELQRAVDGVHFETIYTTTYEGKPENLVYTDKEVKAAFVYYRVAYTEESGTKRFSSVLKLAATNKADAFLYAASAQELRLRYSTQTRIEDKLVVQAVSLNGMLLYQKEVPVRTNNLQASLYLGQPLETCFLVVKDAAGTILYKGYYTR
jgi:hypothetical protein